MKRAEILVPLVAFRPAVLQAATARGRERKFGGPREIPGFCYYFHSIGGINGLYPFPKNEYSTAAVKAVRGSP